MKNFLNVAVILALFAFVLFAGCMVQHDDIKPIPEVSTTQQTTEAVTENITSTETTTEKETQPELVYLDMGKFKLTAYCNCKECCGIWSNGKTATGTIPKQGRTIAVDEDVIPYGSTVIIGDDSYIAEDCGGSVIGKHIDIYFDSHADALEFGVQYADVLLKVGDS